MAEYHGGSMTIREREEADRERRERIGRERWKKQGLWKQMTTSPSDYTPERERGTIFPDG